MLRSLLLKRLSALFVALSLSLWAAKLSLHWRDGEKCELTDTAEVKSTQQEGGGEGIVAGESDPAKWLQAKLEALMSPAHQQLAPSPSCPALTASINPLPAEVQALPNLLADNRGHLGTLSVIGEVWLRPGGRGQKLVDANKVSTWLGGMSSLIGNSDAVLTNFPTPIQKSDSAQEVLSILSSLGPHLVVSLANTAFTPQTNDDVVSVTARALEGAEIDWLGVHAKKHHMITVGGGRRQRVGVLAFCGVHRECVEGTTLPFSPVKYSAKVAKSAVTELKDHGVMVIIVLMYWGLETSYFPDEMTLTIARHLSSLGVSAVVGHHPNSVQGHAYFGNTLVIFSLGKILSSSKVTNYCCKEGSEGYSTSKSCSMVHPNLRDKLCERELQTWIYRLHLSGQHPVTADYMTLQLEQEATDSGYAIRRPAFAQEQNWTQACSDNDTHCLACQQF